MTHLPEQLLQRSARCAWQMLLAILTCAATALVHAADQAPAQRSFVVFDSIRNQGKPDLRSYGLQRLTVVFGHNWAKPGATMNLDEAAVTRGVEKSVRGDTKAGALPASGPFFLDIENLPLLDVSAARADASIAMLSRVAQLAREARPQARFGFYGVLPVRVFAPILDRDQAAIARWHEANRRAEAIARYVDFIFPSLYTLDDDPRHWEAFAKAMLTDARRYGRPVYPFIWPKYHDKNPKLRDQWLPAAFWRQQLELCAQYADGVVIWGSAHDPWNADAPWWAETQEFLRQHRAAKP